MPKITTVAQLLNAHAEFTLDFGGFFILQTGTGEETQYWKWRDPAYSGDNSIQELALKPPRAFNMQRAKGTHLIERYCGGYPRTIVFL